ncbi:MAG: RnfH family protein [Usitatibacter sp.]
MRVSIAVALPGRQEVIDLDVPDGATLADVVQAAGLHERFPEIDIATATFGIWARLAKMDAVLREGDRVELYRGLKADAKAMRRERARIKPASPRSRNEP